MFANLNKIYESLNGNMNYAVNIQFIMSTYVPDKP